MFVNIDFDSDAALYVQLRNQIIMSIAAAQLMEGDSLPSVRALADHVGINMHTVNKAYSVLRREGFVKLDRRRGAYVAVETDPEPAIEDLAANLRIVLAEAICRQISRAQVHRLVDRIYDAYENDKENPWIIN